jgi:hypothetical protein
MFHVRQSWVNAATRWSSQVRRRIAKLFAMMKLRNTNAQLWAAHLFEVHNALLILAKACAASLLRKM